MAEERQFRAAHRSVCRGEHVDDVGLIVGLEFLPQQDGGGRGGTSASRPFWDIRFDHDITVVLHG